MTSPILGVEDGDAPADGLPDALGALYDVRVQGIEVEGRRRLVMLP